MKHLLFTAFLLLGTFNYAQTKVIVPHPETGREMFYFNEEPYKDWELKYQYSRRSAKTGELLFIKTLAGSSGYVKIAEYDDSLQITEVSYHTSKEYAFVYNKEKLLEEVTSYFQTLPIGVWKEYNDKGEVTKENDMDKQYKMSIDCLMQIMKERYDIDLIKDPVSVLYTEKTRPIYIVTYSYGPYTSRWITIDINTGETLFDKRLSGDDFYEYEEQIYRPK